MSHALHTAQLTVLKNHTHLPMLAGVAVRFAVVITNWDTRRTSRRALKRLTPDLLKDIGIDHMSAQIEASKYFWQR